MATDRMPHNAWEEERINLLFNAYGEETAARYEADLAFATPDVRELALVLWSLRDSTTNPEQIPPLHLHQACEIVRSPIQASALRNALKLNKVI